MLSLAQWDVIWIASVVAVACALPGVFLILRGVALLSDAISHAILLGIVLMFFLVKDLNSIWLIFGAALAGVLTVVLTELLIKTERIKKDAAIGLVFPVFFSLGVILISHYAGKIHLDTDAVLLGELAFAPFHRVEWFGMDMGPYSLWVMGVILCFNLGVLLLFYKELKLATFDPNLARALGLSPLLIHYGLMTVTSVTAVGAFDAVGSILVVALMITPPASAYLLTYRLPWMIVWTVLIALCSAWSGYGLAHWLDASIAGSIASMTGVFFMVILCCAPERGLIFKFMRARYHRVLFSGQLLMVQLLSHEGTDKESTENTIGNMITHMEWLPKFSERVLKFSVQNGWVIRDQNQLFLTPLGREVARSVMVK